MTYTVKNGTWCKDNNKEYYSTTKTGLKAALAAGEITSGTKVVIHEPQYHAGQLIQSLNPECPEGCFVPHGQAFDTSIYTELAKIFTGGTLPDMRECVMVCAGQNEHINTHEHDVFNAGEFKDDCAIKHSHTITVTDPGHAHGVTDPGHKHSVTDPGHSHDVNDPGHDHTVTDPGHSHGVTDPGHKHGISVPIARSGAGLDYITSGSNLETNFIMNTDKKTTGVSVNDNTTGVSVNDNTTGVSVNSNKTSVSVNSNKTSVSVKSNKTGITATCSTAGANNATVTRTKQFGVYYYIAF